MAERDSKRLKTDEPYELIYWPGIPGRGEFIRLLFEEAGVAYTDTAKSDDDQAVPTVLGYISAENTGDDINPPVLAPPILKHGQLVIHQTSNMLLYLAPKLGLGPAEGDAVYHLNQIVLTILDGLSDEAHDSHHPIAVSWTYEDQKPESEKRAKIYIAERLPKFLGWAQRLLDAKTSGDDPWLYGGKLTYADLVLFQAVDGVKYAFPKATAKLEKSGKYDGVFKLHQAVKERPNISAYLASERRSKYSSGIYRQYPELDE